MTDSNTSTFDELVQARVTRRNVLGGGIAAAAAFVFGGVGSALRSPTAGAAPGAVVQGSPARPGLLGFRAVPMSSLDDVVVPEGYRTQVLIPWGDPIVPGGPAFRPDASNTPDEQARQFGMGHDGMHFFPLAGAAGRGRGLLVVNHEYTDEELLFPDGKAGWNADKTTKALHAHGVSIVELLETDEGWEVVASDSARRITGRTPMTFSGPAASHRLLRTGADPSGTTVLGTLNNCAHGATPWGTYLACEENFNGYFRDLGERAGVTAEDVALFARYGVNAAGFGYLWHTTDERFRADRHPHEPNRFGWVVEIDPFDPGSIPVKRTALGRMKHESATFAEGSGKRAVVYSGDDEQFNYVYKFVGNGNWEAARARGESPLDDGVLYVARFQADGTGTWLPLVQGAGPLTPANGFADQGDVLVKTRTAADLVGATRMDRPEWVAVDPRHGHRGEVYCTMTNNTRRTPAEVDPANPRANNRWGHIVRWLEAGNDHAATSFTWEVFLLAGPGGGTDGSTVDAEDAFGSPDGLWFDAEGRLWIQTDGSQPGGHNDQMLAADPGTGELRRFLTGVRRCEVTGIAATPDGRTLFVNIQHPGDNGTPANPTVSSSWPDHNGTRPRPATVVVTKLDGGRIGT